MVATKRADSNPAEELKSSSVAVPRATVRLTVGTIRRADLRELTELHRDLFPDDLFTMAGRRVVKALFEDLAAEPTLVLRTQGRIVGYIAGAMNKSRFLWRFAARHPLTLTTGLIQAVALNPGEMYRYVRGFRHSIASTAPGTATAMYLAFARDAHSIGVPPMYWLRVGATWTALVESRGASAVELQTTDRRLVYGYERLGAHLDRTVHRDGGVTYFMSCELPSLRAVRWRLPLNEGNSVPQWVRPLR